MTRKRRIRIPHESKAKIIEELIQESSDIKILATKYQVTAKTLSKWRSDYYKAAKTKELTESQQRFVELQVGDDIKRNHLQKIELILDNHKCSIEGRLNSGQIIKLLALLEETSC
jgi:transposase-like protein